MSSLKQVFTAGSIWHKAEHEKGHLFQDDLRAHCVHRPVVRLVCCVGRAPELGRQRPALVLELVHAPV